MLTAITMVFLFVLAMILSMVGSIWLIIAAFREHILWGLAVLLLPIASLVFVITHWEEARIPFFINLASIGIFVVGIFSMPSPTDGMVSSADGVTEAPAETFSFFDPISKWKEKREQAARQKIINSETEGRGFTGWTLLEVEEKHGPPQGRAEINGKIEYNYPELRLILISTNGLTVTGEIHK